VKHAFKFFCIEILFIAQAMTGNCIVFWLLDIRHCYPMHNLKKR